MISRRTWIHLLLIACITLFNVSFASPALALGGKLPPLNEPAPEFTKNSGSKAPSFQDG